MLQFKLNMRILSRFLIGASCLLILSGLVAAYSRSHSDTDKIPGSNPPPSKIAADEAAPGDGNREAFCRFVSDIDNAGNMAATSQNQYMARLKSFQPRFAQALIDAPKKMKPYAQTMINVSESLIRSNDAGGVSEDTITEATSQLDLYCGISVPPR